MVTVIHIQNPFEPLLSQEKSSKASGQPLHTYINDNNLKEFYDIFVSVDGKLTVDFEQIIESEQVVSFGYAPKGGGGNRKALRTALLVGLAFAALPAATAASLFVPSSLVTEATLSYAATALTIVGGVLINQWLPPETNTSPINNPGVASPTYGWNVDSNPRGAGSVIQVLYGKTRVTPQVISQYVTTSGNDQNINVLYGVAEGQIDDITQVFLDEQDSSTFGVYLPGELGDAPRIQAGQVGLYMSKGVNEPTDFPQGFEDVRIDIQQGVELLGTGHPPTIVETSGNSTDGIEVIVSGTQGLYTIDDLGEIVDLVVPTAITAQRIEDEQGNPVSEPSVLLTQSANANLDRDERVSWEEFQDGEFVRIQILSSGDYADRQDPLAFTYVEGRIGTVKEYMFADAATNVFLGTRITKVLVIGGYTGPTSAGRFATTVVRDYDSSTLPDRYRIVTDVQTTNPNVTIDPAYAFNHGHTFITTDSYNQTPVGLYTYSAYFLIGDTGFEKPKVVYYDSFVLANPLIPAGTQAGIRGNGIQPVTQKFFLADEYRAAGKWQISAARANAAVDPDTPEARKTKDTITLSYVTQISTEALLYPNLSTLTMNALATNKINGSVPKLECIADRGLITVPTDDQGSTFSGPSSNPAYACLDMLTNTRYGIGISPTQIDFAKFAEWAAFCNDPLGDGSVKYESNIYFDSAFDAYQALATVSALGKGMITTFGNIYTVQIDRRQLVSQAFMFNMGNIIKDSFVQTFVPTSDRINQLDVSFKNEADEYSDHTIQITQSDFDTNVEPNKGTMNLIGCTNYTQAQNLANSMLIRNRYMTQMVSFDADIDSLACTVGDLIRVSHDVPLWENSGRVLGVVSDIQDGVFAVDVFVDDVFQPVVITKTLKLDQEITYEAGKEYTVWYRNKDTDVPDVYYNYTVTSTITTDLIPIGESGVDENSLYTIGEELTESKEFRITSITRSEDMRRKVTAMEYIDSIYDDTPSVVELPPVKRPVTTHNVTANFIKYYDDASGNYKYNIALAWQGEAYQWSIAYKNSYTQSQYTNLGTVSSRSYVIQDVVPGNYSILVGGVEALLYIPFDKGFENKSGFIPTDVKVQFEGEDLLVSWQPPLFAQELNDYRIKVIEYDVNDLEVSTVEVTASTTGFEYLYTPSLTVGHSYKFGVASNEGVKISEYAFSKPIGIKAVTGVTGITLSPRRTAIQVNVVVSLTSGDTLEYWSNTVDDLNSATLIQTTRKKSYRHEGLAELTRYYYWARVIDSFGNASSFYPTVNGVNALTTLNAAEIMADLKSQQGTDQFLPSLDDMLLTGVVNGNNWVGVDGSLVVDGTLVADKLSVSQLSAITADIGIVQAGIVRNNALTTFLDLNATGTSKTLQLSTENYFNHDGTFSLSNGGIVWNGTTLTIGGTINDPLINQAILDAQNAADTADAKAVQAQIDANAANANAVQAQIDADTANALVSDISSDGKFDESEKYKVLAQWDDIQDAYTAILAQAATFGVSSTTYTTKYNALDAYITPLLATTTTEAITRTTFNTSFREYYSEEVAIRNAIAKEAKDRADTADGKAVAAQSTANSAVSAASIADGKAVTAQNQADFATSEAQGIKTNIYKTGTTTIDGGVIATDSIWVGGVIQSADYDGTSGFRLKAGAAGTSADPTIYGAYIKGAAIAGSYGVFDSATPVGAPYTHVGVTSLAATGQTSFYAKYTNAGANQTALTGFNVQGEATGVTNRSTFDVGFFANYVNKGVAIYNSATYGLEISTTGSTGIRVENSGGVGLYVNNAGNSGFYCDGGATNVSAIYSTNSGGNGFTANTPAQVAFRATSPGSYGFYVSNAGNNGYTTTNATGYGIYSLDSTNHSVVGRKASGYNYVGFNGSGVSTFSVTYDGNVVATSFTPFTGSHIAKSLDILEKGDLVYDVAILDRISVDDVRTSIKLCDTENDKRVVGVYSGYNESMSSDSEYGWEHPDSKYTSRINSVGEGQMFVCELGGDFEAGDLITSSTFAGKGQKQADDLVHSYTAGKIREAVTWADEVVGVNGCLENTEGIKYKLVACIYMCG